MVPILAPMMTPIACAKVRSPAFTKLTTMMVVAVDDWIAAVTPTPVIRRLKELDVIDARNDRRPSPATFCKPTLNRLSPNRKSATAPIRVTNCTNICISADL